MKFSELWLREWVNPAIDSTALIKQITMAGLKVDGVKPVAGYFTGIVVGQIMECWPHPNINKLWVTKVNIDGNRLLNIVCGAPNCRVGLKVAVAAINAMLPGKFKIKSAKLHGELSEGMLCSFAELGIADDHSVIIELPVDAPIGQNIREYLQLEDNTIEISVTPNRADCLSILGIARDVAVYNRMSFVQPIINNVAPIIGDTLMIHVDAADACPRYLSRILKNINICAPTPLWMKEKLRRCGLPLVNAVVDITNFVLLELGQPIHAFDLNCIDGKIVVRYAQQGETLTLPDGSEVMISTDTIVIADNGKILAIAGIFIGAASSVSLTTSNIVLECAFFKPIAIIGRARRYGLCTDASRRYEYGVDPMLQRRAIERASALLVDICGGQPGPVIDITYEAALVPIPSIILRRKKLDQIIGHVIQDQDVSDILSRLGCQINRTEAGWQVIAPSWRFDIAIEEDLIEEIARIYGYDMIPSVPMRTKLVMPIYHEAILPLSRAKMLLVDRGYQEAITYSFVDPKIQSILHPQQSPLVLSNPISREMSSMRLSLWTGLLSAVVYNQNRQQKRIRLFESGLRFIPDNTADLGIRQDFMLAGAIAGLRFDEHWDNIRQQVDFYDVKGDLEAIFELSGKLENIEFKVQQHAALHPGQSAAIYLNNEPIGFIGVIHPELEVKLNLNSRILIFELLWEKIAECKVPKASNISRFPANYRDISVVVADYINVADIIKECKKNNINQLVDVKLLDVYRGKKIKKGFKSLTIRLILQNITRTLVEEEIAANVAKCVTALKKRFKASLRN